MSSLDFGYLLPSSQIHGACRAIFAGMTNGFRFHFQVSDLGKKGWSSLAGNNLSSPQGGFDANGSNNYQSSGLSNSNSHHDNNDWNNDT